MPTRLRSFVILGFIAIGLAALFTQFGVVTGVIAPFIYAVFVLIWELALFVPDITYWVVLGIVAFILLVFAFVSLLMATDDGGGIIGDDERSHQAAPVARYTDLLINLTESQFFQQQMTFDLSTKLLRAMGREERSRRDINKLLIDNTLNLPQNIIDYLLDENLNGAPLDEILDDTLSLIEAELDIEHERLGGDE